MGTVVHVRAMKAYTWSGVIAPLISNLCTRWECGQLHALAALSTGKNPVTLRIGDWVGPGDGLDILDKGKIFCPLRESNRDYLWSISYSSCYIDYIFPAAKWRINTRSIVRWWNFNFSGMLLRVDSYVVTFQGITLPQAVQSLCFDWLILRMEALRSFET
jgi:hypothetical protein